MVALKAHLARSNLTQAQIAKLLGVTQPRVSDPLRGKINVFGLDALVDMATAAGLRVKMSIQEAAYRAICMVDHAIDVLTRPRAAAAALAVATTLDSPKGAVR